MEAYQELALQLVAAQPPHKVGRLQELKMTEEVRNRLAVLWGMGIPIHVIAEVLECHRMTVHFTRQKMGLPPRKPWTRREQPRIAKPTSPKGTGRHGKGGAMP